MRKKIVIGSLKILLFAFCGAYIFWGFYDRNKLQKKHLLTIGKIDNLSQGKGSSLSVHFTFYAKGEVRENSGGYTTSDFSSSDFNNYFLGKTFPVVYNPDDPSISAIMLFPKQFKLYGYQFPDSLN